MKKIFLVDDLKIINLVNKKYLSGIVEGMEILEFEDPKKALKALPLEMPDLIFLDLSMPEVSGWDILAYMEKESIHIPVIILTSSECQEDRDKANLYGNVIAFQLKPLTKDVIKDLMSGVLERRRRKAG